MNNDHWVVAFTDAILSGRITRRDAIKRAGALGLGAAALAALPGGFVRVRSARAQEGGGELIVGTSQEAVNFNPLLYANTGIETLPDVLMFDSLMKLMPDGSYVPNLATEVPTQEKGGISPDGLSWTFKLRNDVKWHDGQPFTSRDVQFTWETVMNENVAVRSRTGHDKVESVETPDEYTAIIKLKEPFAPFKTLWTSGITSVVPAHILGQEADINTAAFNTQAPIGTGPFKFVEHVGGDHLTVEPNPDYHGGPPKLERIIVKLVPEVPVLFTQFKTGEIGVVDYQGIQADRWEEAQELEGREVVQSPSNFVEFIYFNNSKPWFQDKRVKQAIYHATDAQTIIDAIYYSLETPTLTYLPPTHWAYNPDVKTYPYELERANALLDEAGWIMGGDGVREKDGTRLAFSMSTSAGNQLRESAQLILQQAWKEIGVDMQIDNRPASTLWTEDVPAGNFDTLMVAWDNAIPSDPDPTSRLHSQFIPAETGVGANYVQFKNAEADQLMEAGVRETDQAKRAEIYKQLQALLSEELPWAPLFNNVNKFGFTSSLRGYRANPYLPTNFDNAAEWSLTGE
ncbi:MAG: peptide ABC transporter substrate-binding protein [Chloroflexota bacterium]|nr:peptide ABC transporter substrate-binding protein [Chloroflexota bacterium]